jgi:hypothetical protein
MDTVGIRVPTRQIRLLSTFSVSSALRHSPKLGSLLQMTYADFLTFSANTLSPFRTLSLCGKVSRLVALVCFILLCFS